MLSMFGDMFEKKANKELPNETEISVRSPDQVQRLDNLIIEGPVTFVLVHADWCGPCQRYKPQWKELADIPGRQANVAMIHHDMVEKSETLKNAKIPGYPSVLKVYPNGHIETYKDSNNKPTNAMPNLNDPESMKKELLEVHVNNNTKNSQNAEIKQKSMSNTLLGNNIKPNRLNIMPVSRLTRRNVANSIVKNSGSSGPMKGGRLFMALADALKATAPVATLLFANAVIQKKQTSIPPKKNRGSTMRLTRKSKSRKNNKN